MSTRSIIAIENATDKTVKAIYCHFDGYVHGGVGETLHTHYQDDAKIAALIELGPISILEKDVVPAEGVQHSYENRADGVTVAYHRDRGEKYEAPNEYESAQHLLEIASNAFGAEYVYLWRDGKWFVGSPFAPENGYTEVENVLNN